MKKAFLAAIAFLPAITFAQVEPWPWGKYLATASFSPQRAHMPDRFVAVASRTGSDEIHLVVYGKKQSPAYTAVLTEQPGLLKDIIGGQNGTLVVRLELTKSGPGTIVPQEVTPFAVTKSLKTSGDRIWLVYEDKAYGINVVKP